MKRRLTAWLTILAMLAGVAWPAHAGHLASARGPMSDLCSAVKPSHSTPAAPATVPDECAKCCACSGGAAAAALIGSTLTADPGITPCVGSDARLPHFQRDLARVRGPPAFA